MTASEISTLRHGAIGFRHGSSDGLDSFPARLKPEKGYLRIIMDFFAYLFLIECACVD